MNPGRELDALVAKHVFGLGQHKLPEDGPQAEFESIVRRNRYEIEDCPAYSTDIAAAWEVVELMANRTGEFELRFLSGWSAGFGKCPSDAPSAPHAICLAALRAVGAL